jgi:hypothetical protein
VDLPSGTDGAPNRCAVNTIFPDITLGLSFLQNTDWLDRMCGAMPDKPGMRETVRQQ